MGKLYKIIISFMANLFRHEMVGLCDGVWGRSGVLMEQC